MTGRPAGGGSGSANFGAGPMAYEAFMGRYSRPLAEPFADLAGIGPTTRVLDVGCGSGALTAVAVGRTGAERVCAIDPVPGFVEACRRDHPGVDVRQASAEQIPFPDRCVDCAAAELVLHFVADPARAVAEMTRVVRPGGVLAACVWDFDGGMQLLRAFWDAASSVDPDAPDEARTMRFGRSGELSELFREAGLRQVRETALNVSADYQSFEELWQSLHAGVGPAGSYLVAQSAGRQESVRRVLFGILGEPAGPLRLTATARARRP